MKKVFTVFLSIMLLLTLISTALADTLTIDLQSASDEDLVNAIKMIQAEQRARIKTKIVLSESNITVLQGKAQKIEASIIELPEGEKTPKLTWISSDKAIVNCSNGTIKGVSGGTAVITCSATLADGTEISADCTVQVMVPVSSVTADIKSLNLSGGQSIQPVYSTKPENATIRDLSFESSDESVVTVDNTGKITAVGNGKAKITATTADGSNKSFSISVTVVDHRISSDTVKKVVYTGLGNYNAMDVYTADGMDYDMKKFHPYGYLFQEYSIISEGSWNTQDDGNTWHIEGLLLQNKVYKGYFLFKFDVRFDGKNYYMENGWMENSSSLKTLESKDPSKWGESDLSNLEFYTPFIVQPSLIQ